VVSVPVPFVAEIDEPHVPRDVGSRVLQIVP
jgi:hypothetical protein